MNAKNAARLFIQLGNQQADTNSGDGMTNLRLNKLLYFAQGQSLAKRNRPLFDDQIVAWDFGPVVPSVYYSYKGFEKNFIKDVPPDRELFEDDDITLLLDVYNTAKSLSTSRLVDLSHKAGAPWDIVYNQNGEKGGVIQQESIRDYFSMHPFCSRTFSDAIETLKKKAYTPERDENDVPIIPRGLAYDWN